MSLHPVLPPAVLLVIAAILAAARAQTLSALLSRTGPANRRLAVLRWGAITVAVLLLLVAAARPGVDTGSRQQPDRDVTAAATASNTNVFFVVDRSVDSRVADYGEGASRMSGIRADINTVIDAYPGARFAMIGFAAQPTIDWPLSEDSWSLHGVVTGLSPYVDVAPDAADRVDAAAAANLLRYQLIQAAQQYPDAENLVFYLGAGAGGSRAPQGSFTVGDRVSGGAVLGYGTAGGGPIPGSYVNGDLTYLSDVRTGAPRISALNEAGLRAIAGELGVPYAHRDRGRPLDGLLPAPQAADGSESATLSSTPLSQRIELYWLFALLAAGLLLAEIYLMVRDFRLDRMSRREVRP